METNDEKEEVKKETEVAVSEASFAISQEGEKTQQQPFDNPLLVHVRCYLVVADVLSTLLLHPIMCFSQMFSHCRLVERVLDAWEENEAEEKRSGRRKGYMGHLTKIANVMVSQLVLVSANCACVSDPPVRLPQQAKHAEMSEAPSGTGDASSAHAQMVALPESVAQAWARFAKGALAETNEKNVIIPASRSRERPHY